MKGWTMILVSAAILAAGCDAKEKEKLAPKKTDLGTGLNTVERTYAKPSEDLFEVVADSLRSYDLRVESDIHDRLGGEIVALRADGHKVTAKISSVDPQHAQVAIRVAPGNRNLAEMIHDKIGEKVGAGEVK